MRRAWLTSVALALAACKVDVEGARCSTPKSTAECPAGQACGIDHRCSVECAQSPGSPECNCPAPGSQIAVDLTAASVSGLTRTGAAQPPECRLKTLGDALGAAGALGGNVVVKAYGSGGPVVFAGETLPLAVPASVTLAGADAPAGETVIQGDSASAVPIISLQGTLQGVHIANASMTGNGVEVTCGAGIPALHDVIVSAGATKLARGITVAGSCGALLERLDVSGATGPALDVNAGTGAPITVTGGNFHASGTGIQVTGGTLIFQPDAMAGPTQVANNIETAGGAGPENLGAGILLNNGSPQIIDVTLNSVVVKNNAGIGIYVNSIPITSSLTMTSCDVHSNGTTNPQIYGSAGNQRHAGGVLLTQSSLAKSAFRTNQIYANDGGSGADELAFYSSGTWILNSSGQCGVANAFGCVGTAGGLAVTVTSGAVDATNSIWPMISPPVSAGVTWSPECNGTAPTCPP